MAEIGTHGSLNTVGNDYAPGPDSPGHGMPETGGTSTASSATPTATASSATSAGTTPPSSSSSPSSSTTPPFGASAPASPNLANSAVHYYEATLAPANNSGASGVALLVQQDGTLTVSVDASGLVPNQVHPMHLHGFLSGQPSAAPTLANDTDHDGYINTAEAEAVAGMVLLNLTTNPQLAVESVGSQPGDIFPTADASGNIAYHETFNFNANPPAQTVLNLLQPLGNRLVEIHGLNVPAGAVAGAQGALPGGYQASVPAAGGLLHEIPAAQGQVLGQLLSSPVADHVTLG